MTMVDDHYCMLIKPATTQTLTQCWYTREHKPGHQRTRGDGGITHATCRHCHRPIRSHGGKSWVLADGIDLDELATRSSIRFICVTSLADGLVIARYPLERDADERTVSAKLAEIVARHGAAEAGSGLDVRLMGGPRA
ncbi:MAG: hypothetical protein ACO1OX_06860 [Novosphingobium sp.]